MRFEEREPKLLKIAGEANRRGLKPGSSRIVFYQSCSERDKNMKKHNRYEIVRTVSSKRPPVPEQRKSRS